MGNVYSITVNNGRVAVSDQDKAYAALEKAVVGRNYNLGELRLGSDNKFEIINNHKILKNNVRTKAADNMAVRQAVYEVLSQKFSARTTPNTTLDSVKKFLFGDAVIANQPLTRDEVKNMITLLKSGGKGDGDSTESYLRESYMLKHGISDGRINSSLLSYTQAGKNVISKNVLEAAKSAEKERENTFIDTLAIELKGRPGMTSAQLMQRVWGHFLVQSPSQDVDARCVLASMNDPGKLSKGKCSVEAYFKDAVVNFVQQSIRRQKGGVEFLADMISLKKLQDGENGSVKNFVKDVLGDSASKYLTKFGRQIQTSLRKLLGDRILGNGQELLDSEPLAGFDNTKMTAYSSTIALLSLTDPVKNNKGQWGESQCKPLYEALSFLSDKSNGEEDKANGAEDKSKGAEDKSKGEVDFKRIEDAIMLKNYPPKTSGSKFLEDWQNEIRNLAKKYFEEPGKPPNLDELRAILTEECTAFDRELEQQQGVNGANGKLAQGREYYKQTVNAYEEWKASWSGGGQKNVQALAMVERSEDVEWASKIKRRALALTQAGAIIDLLSKEDGVSRDILRALTLDNAKVHDDNPLKLDSHEDQERELLAEWVGEALKKMVPKSYFDNTVKKQSVMEAMSTSCSDKEIVALKLKVEARSRKQEVVDNCMADINTGDKKKLKDAEKKLNDAEAALKEADEDVRATLKALLDKCQGSIDEFGEITLNGGGWHTERRNDLIFSSVYECSSRLINMCRENKLLNESMALKLENSRFSFFGDKPVTVAKPKTVVAKPKTDDEPKSDEPSDAEGAE